MTELKQNKNIKPTSTLALLFMAVFATFFLSSCSTLKKGDCIEGNWSSIGFNDAAAGLKANSQLKAHTQACSKYEISPNAGVYNAGYKKGLEKFCTTSNGYQYGANKSEYYDVCPAETRRDFMKGYLAGLNTATIQLTEEIADLRYARRRAIKQHREAKHRSTQDAKKIKKWAEQIENLESNIDSLRSDRKQLSHWHDFWTYKPM